jgi:glycosyltransferase involved in cell wall biosynthesis
MERFLSMRIRSIAGQRLQRFLSRVPYHNLPFFDRPPAFPAGPPWKIGYLGRLELKQKNLDQLHTIFGRLVSTGSDTELQLHGHGPDNFALEYIVSQQKLQSRVFFHGPYDHRGDCPYEGAITFIYASRSEGGPFFT